MFLFCVCFCLVFVLGGGGGFFVVVVVVVLGCVVFFFLEGGRGVAIVWVPFTGTCSVRSDFGRHESTVIPSPQPLRPATCPPGVSVLLCRQWAGCSQLLFH